jgi:hypothetical protein
LYTKKLQHPGRSRAKCWTFTADEVLQFIEREALTEADRGPP